MDGGNTWMTALETTFTTNDGRGAAASGEIGIGADYF